MTETSSSGNTSTKLAWIASMARRDKRFCFSNLAHLLTIEHLHEAHLRVRHDGAAGVDRVTAEEYDLALDGNLAALHARLAAGTYRAPAVRRVHIPKAAGKTRPIGIPTFEDKIVQRSVVMLLEPIYEQDFLNCSHGFRPGRGAHQALDRLWGITMRLGGGWVLDVDLRDFFGSLSHEVLQELVAHRVGDGRIRRLIGKWLKAGVMEQGKVSYPEQGTPQGGVISPLLANICLHYVLDVWFEDEVKPRLSGTAELIRYAADFVIVCERERDAVRLAEVLPRRLGRFGLAVNEDKTRVLRFVRPDRMPANDPPTTGRGTFGFLGFTHFWRRSPRSGWVLTRKTMAGRFARALRSISDWCRTHRSVPIDEQHRALCRKVKGHYAYYGVRGNFRALSRFRYNVYLIWVKWLQRRSQRSTYTRAQRQRIANRWSLPPPRLIAS